MPQTTIVEIAPAEQAQLKAELRRARYGHLLTLHILLLCATGRTPTEIAAFLFCSRSSVYRIVRAYQAGSLVWEEDAAGQLTAPTRTHTLSRSLQRSLLAILKVPPRACGWCRTRWSCAPIALELQARRGSRVSTETVRRWLHQLDWEWKRAKLVAKDDDPQRVEKLARIRWAFEQVRAGVALVFAAEGRLPVDA
jgi:transposase